MNALAALQLCVWRRPAQGITGRPGDVLAAIALYFAITVLIQYGFFAAAGSYTVALDIYGVQLNLGISAAWVLTLVLAALLFGKGAQAGPLLVAAFAASAAGNVLIMMLFFGLGAAGASEAWTYWLSVSAGNLPGLIAVTCLLAEGALRRAFPGFCVAALAAAQAMATPYIFETGYFLTYGAGGEDYAGEDGVPDWSFPDPEVIYPIQAGMVAKQAEALRAEEPGQVDLYAIVGAGTPYQEVFQREVAAMSALLARSYDAKGRVMRLGAQKLLPAGRPLLNRTNLSQALQALASRMNPAEDVALIFLTSHGMPDTISTSFYGLSEGDLTSREVAAALDASGIQNAVLVISACYSGSFVDELEGPGRLVLTASAADRNSFGCRDSQEFTDWGRAFIVEALAETRDFRAAGEHARKLVAAREAEQGLTPSLPQISEGEGIGAVLDRLTQRVLALN